VVEFEYIYEILDQNDEVLEVLDEQQVELILG